MQPSRDTDLNRQLLGIARFELRYPMQRRSGHAIRPTSLCTLIACLVVLATPVRAASDPTRVLLDGTRSDPVYRRIESELRLLEIQVAQGSGAASLPSLGSDSNPGEPAAVVHVEPTRVVISLGQRHAGGELVIQRRPGQSPGIVALAAVELLRARMLHPREAAGSTPPSGPSDSSDRTASPSKDQNAPSSPPATASARSAARPWGLFVGPGAAASAGGVPAAVVVHVAADWRSRVGLYAAARLVPGLTRTSWEIAAGRCTQQIGWAGVAGGYAFVFARDQLALAFGAGGGVLRSSYQTVPDAANKASEALSGVAWAGTLHGETSLAWYPLAHLGLALSGLLATTTSSIELPNRARTLPESSNANQTGASFGRPLGLVSLGLAARL
ncbi:MAG: hypothetical protein JW940_10075 [Polyangiaceae bacterium]|nr:hypothetical protein [Polyangiaceae bacterium]